MLRYRLPCGNTSCGLNTLGVKAGLHNTVCRACCPGHMEAPVQQEPLPEGRGQHFHLRPGCYWVSSEKLKLVGGPPSPPPEGVLS